MDDPAWLIYAWQLVAASNMICKKSVVEYDMTIGISNMIYHKTQGNVHSFHLALPPKKDEKISCKQFLMHHCMLMQLPTNLFRFFNLSYITPPDINHPIGHPSGPFGLH